MTNISDGGNVPFNKWIELVANPFEWSDGKTNVIRPNNQADFDYWLAEVQKMKFPDLSDQQLFSRGYPGFAYLCYKVYEVKEVTDDYVVHI